MKVSPIHIWWVFDMQVLFPEEASQLQSFPSHPFFVSHAFTILREIVA